MTWTKIDGSVWRRRMRDVSVEEMCEQVDNDRVGTKATTKI